MSGVALISARGLVIGLIIIGGLIKASGIGPHAATHTPRASMDPFVLMVSAPRDLPVEHYTGH